MLVICVSFRIAVSAEIQPCCPMFLSQINGVELSAVSESLCCGCCCCYGPDPRASTITWHTRITPETA